MSSLKRHDGELMIDHRGTEGIPEELTKAAGLPALPPGRMVEMATIGCCHCGAVVVVNPERIRPREYCQKCDRYICDWCKAASLKAEYVHRTFNQIAEMVMSGRYTISGSASAPILTPVGNSNGKKILSAS